MDTLYSLWRESGHDPATIAGPVQSPVSERGWSGPGEREQWPSLQAYWNNYDGGDVNERSALNYASVYASVRVRSMIFAAFPLHLYRNKKAGIGRDTVTDDYRYRLLHNQPNGEMSAALFRLYMRQNQDLWGNGYALINWGMSGRADEIWPLRPDWMTVYRLKSAKKVYRYDPQDDNNLREGYYSADEVFHFRGLGDDLLGYSPIRLARQGIGLGMAAVTFGSNFFRNGARPSGILEVAGRIDPKTRPDVEREFSEKYASASNAGKTLIVDQGSKFVSTTIPPDDAQYLETRMFQGGEISAKIYGIPPHLTGDTEKQTSWGTGVEQMSIGFVTYTLMPECVLQESEINIKLLGDGLYCKYNMASLLRADFKTQQEGLQIQRRNGIINGDEWREFLEMNPIADGTGQKYTIEGNMTTMEKVGEDPPAPAAAAPAA